MTDFLTKKKRENEPTTFASWIRKYGETGINALTPDGAATVRAKSLPTYGKNAEALFEKGLQGSGYARFLSEKATRDFSAAKQKYAAETAKTREQNLSGYARYLTSHKEKQETLRKQMIDRIGRGESLDAENAYRQAIAAGLTEENAKAAADLGIAAAKERKTSRLIDMILKERLSQKRVEEYARAMGFAEDEIKRLGLYAYVIGGTTIPNIFDDTNN